MARIFITGSADGLGLFASQKLLKDGHEVVMHARSESRAHDIWRSVPEVKTVLCADLSSIDEVKRLAREVNSLGRFDAVIHNAGVYRASVQQIFMVNVLAPYMLTSMITLPERLIYLSSGLHRSGNPIQKSSDRHRTTYANSKLAVTMLMRTLADRGVHVFANAVDPGWVPTKMGGSGAPDNLREGYETQCWLAASRDEEAQISGAYLYHRMQQEPAKDVLDVSLQQSLLTVCEELSGVKFPF